MSMMVSSNVANESSEQGVNTIVLGGWNFQEEADADRMQSLLSVHQHGLDVLCSRVGDNEALLAAGRVMNRLERATALFNGVILEKAKGRALARFETPDEALQVAIVMHARVAAALPVSGVRLTIGVGITSVRIDSANEVDQELIHSAIEFGRLTRPGDISLCGQTKNSISPELSAVLERHKKALPQTPARTKAETESPCRPLWCLVLECDGRMFTVDERNPELTIGRDQSNQVVLRNRYASRHHTTIKYSDGRFILSDRSTNGTLVMLADGSQKLLQNEEGSLLGAGILVFSNKHSAPMAAKARFETI